VEKQHSFPHVLAFITIFSAFALTSPNSDSLLQHTNSVCVCEMGKCGKLNCAATADDEGK
jgi:hypothetical protein